MTIATVRCPVCDQLFVTEYGKGLGRKRVYCSPRCAWTRKNTVRKVPPPERRCPQCGQTFAPAPRQARRKYCSPACQTESRLGPQIRIYSCATCAAKWSVPRAVGTGRVSPQCEDCIAQRPWRTHLRYRRLILERDDWICQLCFTPIDREQQFPHPSSPSVDHIKPFSLGGRHEPTNLRAAHWGCNHRRGNGTRPPRALNARPDYS